MARFLCILILAVIYLQTSYTAVLQDNKASAVAVNVDMSVVMAESSSFQEESYDSGKPEYSYPQKEYPPASGTTAIKEAEPKTAEPSSMTESEPAIMTTIQQVPTTTAEPATTTTTEQATTTTTEQATTTTTEPATTTTTIIETTTMEAECRTLDIYRINNYSEANKKLLLTKKSNNRIDCCYGSGQLEEKSDLPEWSFSYNGTHCLFYMYVPPEEDLEPLLSGDSNDNILLMKRSSDNCVVKTHHGSFEMDKRCSTYDLKAGLKYCNKVSCSQSYTHQNVYNYGNSTCVRVGKKPPILSTYSPLNKNVDFEMLSKGSTLLTVNNDDEEALFGSIDWSDLIQTINESGEEVAALLMDIQYMRDTKEYFWRKSLRKIPKDSRLWADGYPTDDHHFCIMVDGSGLKNLKCFDMGDIPFLYIPHLSTR